MGKVLDRQDTWKGSAWAPGSQNLYVYVGNNPVNYVDPTGHWAVGVNFGGLIAIGTFGVRGSVGLWIDDNLTVAITLEGGFAQGLAGTLGFSGNWSSVDTVKDMKGVGSQLGATGGIGAEFGIDTSKNVYVGLSKEGAGFYLSENYTEVIPLITIPGLDDVLPQPSIAATAPVIAPTAPVIAPTVPVIAPTVPVIAPTAPDSTLDALVTSPGAPEAAPPSRYYGPYRI